MAKRLAASLVNAVHDAILKSFWRRKTLWRFLRQAGVAESFLATWRDDESKREFLDRLFTKLPDQPRGQDLLLSIARDLAQQDSFPDLVGWEDSERERKETQERFRAFQEEVRRSQQSLESLSRRLACPEPE
jgi:hypothetical protein